MAQEVYIGIKGSHTAAQRTALGNILTDVYANLDQAVAEVRDFLGERIADDTGLSKEIVVGVDGKSFTFNSIDLRTGMPAGQGDEMDIVPIPGATTATYNSGGNTHRLIKYDGKEGVSFDCDSAKGCEDVHPAMIEALGNNPDLTGDPDGIFDQ